MPPKTDEDLRFEIPAGRRPEEYLDDAGLAEFYRRKATTAKPEDPGQPELAALARRYTRAANATAEAVAEAAAIAEADLARSKT
jgi:hypothetical protein